MNPKNRICALNLSDGYGAVRGCTSAVQQRLARSFSRLKDIQLVRDQLQAPNFGKSAETRIIWRELLDLELQEVDQQIEQILAAASANPR